MQKKANILQIKETNNKELFMFLTCFISVEKSYDDL